MSNPPVTINLVILNGEKYIRHCLDGVLAQTYPHEFIELNILDNGSTDNTLDVIGSLKDLRFKKFNLIKSNKNLGMWPGQEELLKYSNGKYVLSMAVDVILDKDFVKNVVEVMEEDDRVGGVEAKIFKYDLTSGQVNKTKIIDTCGFKIFRSRRVINIGHGEPDFAKATTGKEDKSFDLNKQQEIFGVEGAAPFFRREALESCRISPSINSGPIGKDGFSEIFDHDYFWYADDLDLAWRMNLFGWKQVFAPSVIAWHDRQTTKKLRGNFRDFLAIREAIPLRKRQLEWKNVRFTIIKNDYIINILKDLPYLLTREVMMLGYLIFFEPKVLLEIPNFLKLLPRMMAKRKEIMRKVKVSPAEIRKYFK